MRAQRSRIRTCSGTGLAAPWKEFLKKRRSQHTGTTRARTGADWHTHRLTAGAA